MFNLALLAKQARGQATILKRPLTTLHPSQSAKTRAALRAALACPQPRGLGGPQRPRASALLQAPKRAGPQQRRASALLQARKRAGARHAQKLRRCAHPCWLCVDCVDILKFCAAPREICGTSQALRWLGLEFYDSLKLCDHHAISVTVSGSATISP